MNYEPIPKHGLFQDLTGVKFNRLMVLGYAGDLLKPKNTHFRLVTFNGITDTCAGWSRRTGLKEDTISQRLRRNKWSVENTLTKGV